MPANHLRAAAAGAATGRRSAMSAGSQEDVAALTLDDRGMVCDCNHAGETLFKYRRSEMVWRHVSLLLPQLAGLDLVQDGQPNPRLRFLCRIGRHFQAVTRDGAHFASEIYLNVLDTAGHGRLSLIVRPAPDQIDVGSLQPTGE